MRCPRIGLFKAKYIGIGWAAGAGEGGRDRETGRQGDRDRETERDRQTDRQTDRENQRPSLYFLTTGLPCF